MEYMFVACEGRLGSVSMTGPKTGIKWVITRHGSWIAEDDADLLNTEVDSYCFRQQKFLKIRAIYRTSPSENQMRDKPTG